MSSNGDTSNADSTNLYGYVPSKGAGYVFVILFIVTTLLHTIQATRYRAIWLFPTVVVAGAAEVIGWVARTRSSYDPSTRMTYIIQISILVLAPTPFVAALFIGFGRVVRRLGARYSRLSPALYSRIFLTCDILSLMIQGAGGGIAAGNTQDADKARLGSDIILVGLVIQIISMSVFCFLMGEYAVRRSKDRPFHKVGLGEEAELHAMDRNMKFLIVGICSSTFFVYIRCVYRVIEFADGFNGAVAHNQALFIVFDAVMVTTALYILNIMHPARLLLATAQTPSYAMAGRPPSY